MSQTQSRQPLFLQDYRPPAFLSPSIELEFLLDPDATIVTARQRFERKARGDLVLRGEDQELLGLWLDGGELGGGPIRDRRHTPGAARSAGCVHPRGEEPDRPAGQHQPDGLYLSNGGFCTQCEAEGFRKITWFAGPARRAVRASPCGSRPTAAFPRLLSNGNLMESGELPGGRHYAAGTTRSPSPATCSPWWPASSTCLADSFVTMTGRTVELRIYVDHASIGQRRLRHGRAEAVDEVGRGGASAASTTSTCS